MNKKEKGFTLVELLVVIAIVAILATVSVVGYLSFTSKAKVSNDISLTKQMNNILLGEITTEGVNKTAHDAVLDLQENGLDVTKLTPTKEGYQFVYDLKQDKFFLFDETNKKLAPEGDVVSSDTYNVYKFVGKGDTLSTTYANYLKADYVSANGTETISTGFDAGENTTVTTLNYANTNTQNTTIRTNGGTLQVTAPNDTVHHYGNANVVDVISVDVNNSYHEFGNVGTIKAASGRIVVEDSITTSVSSVLVQTPKQGNPNDGVKVHINKVQDSKVTVSKEAGANVTELKDGDVTVDTITLKTGVQVSTYDELKAALLDVNIDKIYLTKDIEMVNSNSTEQFAGIVVSRPIELYGSNYSLFNNGILAKNSRMVDLANVINGAIKISDLTITCEAKPQYLRGINFQGLVNTTVNLNNVKVNLPHYYALHISQNCEKNNVEIFNSVFVGYTTIYNKSCDLNLVAQNSQFIGINPTAQGPSNSFSTIVASEYFGETSHTNYPCSMNNVLKFENCNITAKKINPTAPEVRQRIVDVRNPGNNNVYFNKCVFDNVAEPIFVKVCFDTVFAKDDVWREKYKGTSNVFIDDKNVNNENYTDYYTDLG